MIAEQNKAILLLPPPLFSPIPSFYSTPPPSAPPPSSSSPVVSLRCCCVSCSSRWRNATVMITLCTTPVSDDATASFRGALAIRGSVTTAKRSWKTATWRASNDSTLPIRTLPSRLACVRCCDRPTEAVRTRR